MFSQIDDDLNTQKDRTDKHKELLLVYGRQLRAQKDVNQDLSSRVATLEEEAHVREVQVNELVNSVDELWATINSMMGLLCHCSEGKGKEGRLSSRSRRSPMMSSKLGEGSSGVGDHQRSPEKDGRSRFC